MNPAIRDSLIDLLVRRTDTAVTAAGMVDWATEALSSGLDTPSLVILAGLPRSSSLFEADPWFAKALQELGVRLPDDAQLRRGYVGAVSRAILAGRIPPDEALDLIHDHAVGALGHPPDLLEWCYVWEGLGPKDFRDLDGPEAAAEARRLAVQWAGCDPFTSSSDVLGGA